MHLTTAQSTGCGRKCLTALVVLLTLPVGLGAQGGQLTTVGMEGSAMGALASGLTPPRLLCHERTSTRSCAEDSPGQTLSGSLAVGETGAVMHAVPRSSVEAPIAAGPRACVGPQREWLDSTCDDDSTPRLGRLATVGGMLAGLGIGLAADEPAAGLIAGAGVGLLAAAFLRAFGS